MAKTQTGPWDVVEHLETEEDMAAYLDAALEEGDPALIAAAVGDIARAKAMPGTAHETASGASHAITLRPAQAPHKLHT